MKQTKNGVTPLSDAQRQLVIDHIPFAKELARKFEYLGRQKGITLLQLKTESCSALCEAALRYEPEAGTDFKAYALGWCRKFIKMCLNDWGYAADDVEVLEGELLAEDEEEMEQWRVQRVEAMMSVLNMQEKKVVRLLYGFDGDVKDFREVARIMHLTPASVYPDRSGIRWWTKAWFNNSEKGEAAIEIDRQLAIKFINDNIEKDEWLEEYFPKQMEVYHNAIEQTREQILSQLNL